MTESYRRSSCGYCGSRSLTMFLSLGQQPPSDSFILPTEVAAERRYPLDVLFCETCSLVQLADIVAPRLLFGDYAYLASKSAPLKAHYRELAGRLEAVVDLGAGDLVVDIGCNDGVLLSGYSRENIRRVGVEPSSVAQEARAAGFEVVERFFGIECAAVMRSEWGRAKVVTATNVFPHVDDVRGFAEGVKHLLADDGVFVIEASYLLNLVDDALFDTIYHEHLYYLSLTPVMPFLASIGLQVWNVERVPFGASGPALRIWTQHVGGPYPVQSAVGQVIDAEADWGVSTLGRYTGYAQKVAEVKIRVRDLLSAIRRGGSRVGGYGAPAKGSTLLNYLDLTPADIERIAETNERKIGRLTPGSHIPIVSEEEFLSDMPDYALLLSWNYLDFFLQRSEYIKRGGRFLVPIPTPRIAPQSS